jgi:opacity protein-like surface antigen
MKKLTALLLCLSSTSLYANSDSFTGFYLTGALGATNAQFHVQPTIAIEPFEAAMYGSYEMYGNSPAGRLGLSYLHAFKHPFVLGVEGTASYTRAQNGYHSDFVEFLPGQIDLSITTHLEAELTQDFALLLKPGYRLGKNTLFYGLIGARWGQVKTSITSEFFVATGGSPLTAMAEDEEEGVESGFTAGIGIQQRWNDHFFVSLEYDYTNYGEIEAPSIFTQIVTAGTPVGTLTDQPSVDLISHTVMFAVSYLW